MKHIIPITAALLAVSLTIPALAADAPLSPALAIIAADEPMVKTGLANTDISFTADDFAEALGVESVSRITITSLPDRELGVLRLGSQDVAVGQTINKKNLSSLRFVPYGSDELDTSFGFTTGSGVSYECALYALTYVNSAPILTQSAAEVFAYSGVACSGSIEMADPDGDSVRFELVSQPAHGSVTLTDRERGYYVYTPLDDYEGVDSFEVRAIDFYGGRSNTLKVRLRVDMPEAGEVIADMDGHWAESALITCLRSGVLEQAGMALTVETAGGVEGTANFYPNEGISRAEFLSLVMNAAGYTGFSTLNTGFADDADIPEAYKGSVAAADAIGIISGVEAEDGLRFYPNNQITRCEAAVILSRITGIRGSDELTVSAPADVDSIPAWARSAMLGLMEAGIMRGSDGVLDAYAPLTRAEAVQLAAALLLR